MDLKTAHRERMKDHFVRKTLWRHQLPFVDPMTSDVQIHLVSQFAWFVMALIIAPAGKMRRLSVPPNPLPHHRNPNVVQTSSYVQTSPASPCDLSVMANVTAELEKMRVTSAPPLPQFQKPRVAQ